MDYICNIYLDKTAERVGGGGANSNAFRAAHLWFKHAGEGKGWVPVADPVEVSQANDKVGFKLRDIYGELTDAVYKITFSAPSGGPSPFDDTITAQLANGTYPWIPGTTKNKEDKTPPTPPDGLKDPIKFVTTNAVLTLANQGKHFEFSLEVDDKGSEVYYMDPRMIVDP